MQAYIKSNNPEKIKKVNNHFKKVGIQLDNEKVESGLATSIKIYTLFENYDLDYFTSSGEYLGVPRISIKSAMKVKSWKHLKRLINKKS